MPAFPSVVFSVAILLVGQVRGEPHYADGENEVACLFVLALPAGSAARFFASQAPAGPESLL